MNTINTETYSSVWRTKYRSTKMQQVLRKALVSEAICDVDRSGSYYIQNPYGTQPSAQLQATDGSYSVSAWTTTEDNLTVNNEVIYAEHIYDFERLLAHYDLFSNRTDEQAYAIATGIDKYVLNNLCEDATGTYTTAAGGFTTSANIAKIMGDLNGKVAGFAQAYWGNTFLVIENTDVTGFLQSNVASGFMRADEGLRNGWIGNYMGTDIYVVRTGTFVDETLAGEVVTNSGHRVFGVKRVATYAQPGGLRFEEKGVTAKTGIEFVTYGYVGFKLWTQMASLVVDITLA